MEHEQLLLLTKRVVVGCRSVVSGGPRRSRDRGPVVELTFPIFLWFLFSASSIHFLYSVICLLSGNETPYTRWSESLLASPRK